MHLKVLSNFLECLHDCKYCHLVRLENQMSENVAQIFL